MEALTPEARPPAPVASPWRQRWAQFSVGMGLALFPLPVGLPLAVWGTGFFQVIGIVVLACLPALDGIVVVTLVANYVSRWRWIGALVRLLVAGVLDAILLDRTLAALFTGL